MFRPDIALLGTPAQPGAAPVAPAAPSMPSMHGGTGRFSQTLKQLDGEIRDYIAHGSRESGDVPSLNAAARAYLARTQAPAASPGSGSPADAIAGSPDREAFLGQIAPWAKEASQRLGVAPDILAAHAALESGWGQRPLRNADGASTHNLFGIKAGGGWRGDSAGALTTEYEDGVTLKKTERFRSYPDASAAFRDFAQLMQSSPRYQGALNTGTDVRAYADALARGGYATDPRYADKLVSVVNRLRAR